ncbi:MAG: hypothetical protein AB3N20_14510 [Rhizobiaceae bacterium]
MIKDEIHKYHRLLSALNKAINDDDGSQITILDRDIEKVWQSILSHKPEDETDLVLMVDFLLTIVLPASDRDGTKVIAAERIRSLVKDLAVAQDCKPSDSSDNATN